MVHYEEYHFGEKEYMAVYPLEEPDVFVHFHRSFELLHLTEGRMKLMVDGREFQMEEGEYGLILPYEVHSYRGEAGAFCYAYVFSPDYVESFSQRISRKALLCPVFRVAEEGNWMESLLRTQKGNGELFFLKAALYYLTGCALDGTELIPGKERKSDLLHQILTYIQEHYQEQLTLADLGEHLGYNRTYLSRYINQAVQLSFTDLVAQHRISRAEYLLEHTGRDISELAFECGYGTIRSFNRTFLKLEGMTPGEYRKKKSRNRE